VNVLVTGGAGFIGRHLIRVLLNNGHRIHVLDVIDFQAFADQPPSKLLTSQIGSVLDRELVDEVVENTDIIVHLAAICEPAEYYTNPKQVIDVNVQGSLNLIRSAVKHGSRIIFTSTSEIYGRNRDVPWSEDADRVLGSTSVSRWCYSTGKALIEHYLYACKQDAGLDFTIVRFFNIYGPGLQGRVVTSFIQNALKNRPILIHGDGRQTRTFLYVADAVNAVVSIVNSTKTSAKAYNIGHSDQTPITMIHLAKRILELTSSNSSLEFINHELISSGFADVPKRVPVVEKIKQDVGWEAQVSLEEGLVRTIRSFRYHDSEGKPLHFAQV
jgi:nucleoside-diphosphate-sugar epimerase